MNVNYSGLLFVLMITIMALLDMIGVASILPFVADSYKSKSGIDSSVNFK